MYDFRAFCTNNMSDFVHRDAYRNCNMFLLLGCYSTIVIVYPFVSLIGLGLWSTWKESAVLIITDKVVCLMRHGKTITSFPLTELRSQDYTPCNGMTDPSKSFISVHFLTIRMRNGRQRKAGLIANWQQKSTRRRTGREHIALQLTGHHIGLLCCRKMFQCFLKRMMLYSE